MWTVVPSMGSLSLKFQRVTWAEKPLVQISSGGFSSFETQFLSIFKVCMNISEIPRVLWEKELLNFV